MERVREDSSCPGDIGGCLKMRSSVTAVELPLFAHLPSMIIPVGVNTAQSVTLPENREPPSLRWRCRGSLGAWADDLRSMFARRKSS